MTLTYLFKARLKDGTIIQQTPEDVSVVDPTKSAFYDVPLDEVAGFLISGNGHAYYVDLIDGHFELDRVPFHAGDPVFEIPTGTTRRLIYFRAHTHTYIQGREDHTVDYHIGWQVTVDGKNIQQTISVR